MLSLDNAARFVARDGHIARGIKQALIIPNPAAGADWSFTVPAGEQWQLLTFRSTFTTSAAVANRAPGLRLTVDGVVVWSMRYAAAVTASLTVDVSAQQGTQGANVAFAQGILTGGLPWIMLPQGAVFASTTQLMDVLDQYANIGLYVERRYMTDQQADAYAAEELTELLAAMNAQEVQQ